MPSIMKNGQQFGGVPTEVITAWEPTGDPVQVTQPLMGNTDISNIGNGTVTGAISAMNTGVMHKIYSGAWIRSSTAATNIVLTDSLSVDKGTYLVIVNIPTASVNAVNGIRKNGSDIGRYFLSNRNSYVTVITVESDETLIDVVSGSSASCTYSGITTEGGIFAIKISD